MSLKDTFQNNLSNLGKDKTSEMLLIGNIDFLLNEKTELETKVIFSLLQIKDPISDALSFYLQWKKKPKRNFKKIKSFFSSLANGITKYAQYDNLSTKLVQILIEKRIQFKMLDDLEKDILSLRVFVTNVDKYKLVFIQERIIKIFSDAISYLAKYGRSKKTSSIGLRLISKCKKLEKKYSSSGRFDLERDFIKLRLKNNKIFGIDEEKSLRLRLAESFFYCLKYLTTIALSRVCLN